MKFVRRRRRAYIITPITYRNNVRLTGFSVFETRVRPEPRGDCKIKNIKNIKYTSETQNYIVVAIRVVFTDA